MREHRLVEALSFTFYDVITADIEENPDMAHLQSKCLHPGLYASHIRRWLQYYHVHQVLSSKSMYYNWKTTYHIIILQSTLSIFCNVNCHTL